MNAACTVAVAVACTGADGSGAALFAIVASFVLFGTEAEIRQSFGPNYDIFPSRGMTQPMTFAILANFSQPWQKNSNLGKYFARILFAGNDPTNAFR